MSTGLKCRQKKSVGGRTESCDVDERPKAQQANMVRGDSALTWGEPPGEKPWLETGEVGDWLAGEPVWLRYCWKQEAFQNDITCPLRAHMRKHLRNEDAPDWRQRTTWTVLLALLEISSEH